MTKHTSYRMWLAVVLPGYINWITSSSLQYYMMLPIDPREYPQNFAMTGRFACFIISTTFCQTECHYSDSVSRELYALFESVKYGVEVIKGAEGVEVARGSNDSRLHVVEPPRGRSFIWQIGVNSSIQDRRQVDRGFLWSRVSCTRQR